MTEKSIDRLLTIMRQLRDPDTGCPWDVQQNFATIAPYTIEEAYEVLDAIQRNDMPALKDELGDLLLQVVFHARIAEESGLFDFGDVVQSISDKMERRHPHVFGDGESDGWEAIKAAERHSKDEDKSALSGVAKALPAMMVAEKLQKRAARVGFDWPDTSGPRAKIEEELIELEAANNQLEREDEFGDLLFAVINLGRKLKIDPEVSLRNANDKFERRFRAMEDIVGVEDFASLSLDEQENLWIRVKQAAVDAGA